MKKLFHKIWNFIVKSTTVLLHGLWYLFVVTCILIYFNSCTQQFGFDFGEKITSYIKQKNEDRRQRVRDAMADEIQVEIKLAYKTLKENGISGVIALSKERYELLEKQKNGGFTDLMKCLAIDMFAQSIDESTTRMIGFPPNEYFHNILIDVRAAKARDFITGKNIPSTESMRHFNQKVIEKFVTESLGNQTKYVSGNTIAISVPIALGIIKDSGIDGLQNFSQKKYYRLRQEPNIYELESFIAINIVGYFHQKSKSHKKSTNKYFSPDFTVESVGPIFDYLGYSFDESNRYLRDWLNKTTQEMKKYEK